MLIVNVIIREMLWDSEDINGSTHTNMMRSFKAKIVEFKEVEEGGIGCQFCTEIRNLVQFSLVIEYHEADLSFRQGARVMMSTKEGVGHDIIGFCSDYTFGKYPRYICAVSPQKIPDVIESAWT